MSSHRIMTGKIATFQNNFAVKCPSCPVKTFLQNSSRKKGSEIPEVLYQRTPGNKRRLALMAKVKSYYSEAGRPR